MTAGPPSSATARSSVAAVVLLVALATAIKLAIVLAPAPGLYWLDGARTATFIGEEVHRGSIAKQLVDGPILPLLDYQQASFFGGSLVMGMLSAPVFLLLGPSMLAVKLSALLFQAIVVAFAFLIVDRYAGRRAAWFAGALMAIPPPGYCLLSITAFGSHVESNAFALACTYMVLRLYDRRPPRALTGFSLGLVAGFGMYFSYILAIALVTLALCRFIDDRRFFLRKEFGYVLLGGVLGFLPWLVYNLRHDFEGLKIYGRPLAGHVAGGRDGTALWSRARTLFGESFPDAFFFGDMAGAPAALWNGLYALSLVALLGLAAFLLLRDHSPSRVPAPEPRARRTALRVLVAYPLVYLVFFLATDFKVGNAEGSAVDFRYLYVLYPFLFMAAGVALDRLARERGTRALAWTWATALVSVSLAGSARLVEPANRGVLLAEPGHSAFTFGRFLAFTHAGDPDQVVDALRRADASWSDEELDELHFGVGMYLRQCLSSGIGLRRRERERLDDFAALRERLHAEVEARFQAYFEELPPDARSYGRGQQERFWRDRSARRPERDD